MALRATTSRMAAAAAAGGAAPLPHAGQRAVVRGGAATTTTTPGPHPGSRGSNGSRDWQKKPKPRPRPAASAAVPTTSSDTPPHIRAAHRRHHHHTSSSSNAMPGGGGATLAGGLGSDHHRRRRHRRQGSAAPPRVLTSGELPRFLMLEGDTRHDGARLREVQQRMVGKVLATVRTLRHGRNGARCADRRQRIEDIAALVRFAEGRRIAGAEFYTAAIACLGRLNACHRAHAVFDGMQVQPMPRTYAALATAYFKSGRAGDAERVVQRMIHAGWPPTARIHELRLSLCSRNRDVEGCRRCLEDLSLREPHEPGFRLRPVHILLGAAACRGHREVDDFLQGYLDVIPDPASDPGVASVHLRLAAGRRDVEEVRRIVKQHCKAGTATPRMMSQYVVACRKAGELEEAVAAWGEALEAGVVPDLVLSQGVMHAAVCAIRDTPPGSAEGDAARARLRRTCEEVFAAGLRVNLQHYVAMWVQLMLLYAALRSRQGAEAVQRAIAKDYPEVAGDARLRAAYLEATGVEYPSQGTAGWRGVGRLLPDKDTLTPEYPQGGAPGEILAEAGLDL